MTLPRQPRIIGCIPVRYGSTRLPAKPLVSINGKPLVLHVIDRAVRATQLNQLIILTDHKAIAETVSQAGFSVVLTAESCQSGSDRIVDYIHQGHAGDIFVNIQGDELLLNPQHIDTLIQQFSTSESKVATLAHRCQDTTILTDPSTAKIVTDPQGNALYFSRQAIPVNQRGEIQETLVQIGMYIYTREALIAFSQLEQGRLEKLEKLEQLRFLENRIPIQVVEVESAISLSIDTPADLAKAERYFETA